MNGKERVRRALEFDGPDRAPREMWTLTWAETHYPDQVKEIRSRFPSDFNVPTPEFSEPPNTSGDPHKIGTYRDEWGCEYVNIQEGAMGEVKEPLIGDWKTDLEKVHIPREWLTFDRDKVNEFCRAHSDTFNRGWCCPRPFERLQFLRGPENLYLDLADPPPEMRAFLKTVHEFYCELLEEWAKTEVDGLMMMDDWGAQNSLLISPRTWRAIFRPLYKDYIDIAHSRGKKMFMHSDGFIVDIYPDLIELGLDAINSQVFCMGFDRLAPFKGKIAFWGEMDRQYLLPEGDVDEVREAVREFHANLSENGGVIAQCEFGLMAKPENVREWFSTWDEVSGAR